MDNANPVGQIKQDSAIQNYVTILRAEWGQMQPKRNWWQFWKRASFVSVTKFLLKALDDLIAYVDEVVDTNGADKKATVIWAVGEIYDYIVKEAMPVILKPFAPQIKDIIVNGVISPAIDWMVDKYRNGDWRKPKASELAILWEKQAPLAAAKMAYK